jgi:hypothetical protein
MPNFVPWIYISFSGKDIIILRLIKHHTMTTYEGVEV